MKKIFSLFFAMLMASMMHAKVAFLVPANNTDEVSMQYEDYRINDVVYEQSPERRAWRWFRDNFVTPEKGQFLCFNDLSNIPSDVNAIWIYIDRINFNAASFDALFASHISELQAFVNAGGNLFLCKQATRLEKDLVGAKKSDNSVIEPTYEDFGYKTDYNREDKWGMSVHFFDGDGWGSYLSHKMFSLIPNNHKTNDRHIEMVWSEPLEHVVTNNNCLFDHTRMEMSGDGDYTNLANFQNRNNCRVLGCWHGDGDACRCGGLIEFYPNGDRKGTVIMMGLAAYQWINNNNGWGIENIQYMTKGALEYLDVPKPSLTWNANTVPTSGVIGSDHYMTAAVNDPHYSIIYSADHPEIANIGDADGRIVFNYFGNATFKATTSTGDGWNTPKCDAVTINSTTIPVTGGDAAVTYAYVLPYSLHTMYNYDNEDSKRPDYEAAKWFYQKFIVEGVGGEHGCFVKPTDIASLNAKTKVLWINNDHVGKGSGDYYNDLGGDTFRANLAGFLQNGGSVFVSKQATRLIGDLGRDIYPRYENGGYSDINEDWRVGNKWNLGGTEIDRSTHRVYSNMGTSTTIMVKGRHTNNNCVWDNFDGLPGSGDAGRLTQYETAHECVILGAWGHYGETCGLLECVGFVEYPKKNGVTLNSTSTTYNQNGTIIAMGLASYHWADPTNAIKTLTLNTLSYLNFMNARPCALDNSTPMETKLAGDGFYPSETQSFLKLHPVCENMAATYTLTSNPNNIARIQENVQVGEEIITQLQFKAAGTVTLHIVLTETRTNVNWPTGTYEYDREITFSYPYDSPRASDNSAMADKLADAYFYPANTTTFRTLHPVCEGINASYTLPSNPNGIARIQGGQLQFQAAGTVTLRVTLTENREYMYWPTGVYNYDREITFAYANANAAQDAVNADLSSNGFTEETIEQEIVYMAMRLHPSIRGLDSLSYTIANHHDATQGEAYKKTEDGVTRLYFTKSGKVLLTVRMNEPNWREEWTPGEKEFTHVVEFNYAHETGPDFPWPSEFETGAVGPNSVITLPATVGGLAVTYTVEGAASLSGNVLTLADVESGSVNVHASITETVYKTDWPMGTYNYNNTLSFHAAEVGYLLPAAESIGHMAGWYEGEQPEYNAATWFQETYIATGKGRFVTVSELPTLFAKGITTLWVNIERISITPEDGLFTDIPTGLKTYIQAGGNVLLTKQATRLAYLMERIAYAPDFTANGYSTTDPGIGRCIYTRMGTGDGVDEVLDMSGHRIYIDMLSYEAEKRIFLVAPSCKKTNNYCSWRDFYTDGSETHAYGNAYIQRLKDFENAWHATVFGIQGGVGDYCLSDIVEFNATGAWQGRILAIGSAAYQWGSSNNNVERDNLKTLTANCLAYLANEEIPEEVYTRDIVENMFGTICWGYDVEAGKIAGAEIYELTSFNAAGDGVILTEVNSMVGGRPYFFLGTSSQLRLTYTGQKKEAEVGGHNGLVGYIPLTGEDPYLVPEGKYILYNNQLLLVDSEIYLPVHRAYVNYEDIPAYDAGAPAGPRRRVVAIDRRQTPTGLDEITLPSKQGTYDILGRKVVNPQGTGFYIIDGQKVVITH